MITEDYVSFETAKLLRERGFGGECMSMYVTPKPHAGMGNPNEAKIAPHGRDSHYYDGYLYQCEAPTLQMAMKWLREVHKLGIFPTTFYRHLSKDKDIHNYGSTIVNLNTFEIIGDKTPPVNGGTYTFEADTYEETAEKAIRYCLENLI